MENALVVNINIDIDSGRNPLIVQEFRLPMPYTRELNKRF